MSGERDCRVKQAASTSVDTLNGHLSKSDHSAAIRFLKRLALNFLDESAESPKRVSRRKCRVQLEESSRGGAGKELDEGDRIKGVVLTGFERKRLEILHQSVMQGVLVVFAVVVKVEVTPSIDHVQELYIIVLESEMSTGRTYTSEPQAPSEDSKSSSESVGSSLALSLDFVTPQIELSKQTDFARSPLFSPKVISDFSMSPLESPKVSPEPGKVTPPSSEKKALIKPPPPPPRPIQRPASATITQRKKRKEAASVSGYGTVRGPPPGLSASKGSEDSKDITDDGLEKTMKVEKPSKMKRHFSADTTKIEVVDWNDEVFEAPFKRRDATMQSTLASEKLSEKLKEILENKPLTSEMTPSDLPATGRGRTVSIRHKKSLSDICPPSHIIDSRLPETAEMKEEDGDSQSIERRKSFTTDDIPEEYKSKKSDESKPSSVPKSSEILHLSKSVLQENPVAEVLESKPDLMPEEVISEVKVAVPEKDEQREDSDFVFSAPVDSSFLKGSSQEKRSERSSTSAVKKSSGKTRKSEKEIQRSSMVSGKEAKAPSKTGASFEAAKSSEQVTATPVVSMSSTSTSVAKPAVSRTTISAPVKDPSSVVGKTAEITHAVRRSDAVKSADASPSPDKSVEASPISTDSPLSGKSGDVSPFTGKSVDASPKLSVSKPKSRLTHASTERVIKSTASDSKQSLLATAVDSSSAAGRSKPSPVSDPKTLLHSSEAGSTQVSKTSTLLPKVAFPTAAPITLLSSEAKSKEKSHSGKVPTRLSSAERSRQVSKTSSSRSRHTSSAAESVATETEISDEEKDDVSLADTSVPSEEFDSDSKRTSFDGESGTYGHAYDGYTSVPRSEEKVPYSSSYTGYTFPDSIIPPGDFSELYAKLPESTQLFEEERSSSSEVRFGAFAPPEIVLMETFKLNIWAYTPKQHKDVLVKEAMLNRAEMKHSENYISVQIGQEISIEVILENDVCSFLESPSSNNSVKTLTWEGIKTSASFSLKASDKKGKCPVIVNILMYHVPVTSLRFSLSVVAKRELTAIKLAKLECAISYLSSIFAFVHYFDQLEFLRWKLALTLCNPHLNIRSSLDSSVSDSSHDLEVFFVSNASYSDAEYVKPWHVIKSRLNSSLIWLSGSDCTTIPDELADGVHLKQWITKFSTDKIASELLDIDFKSKSRKLASEAVTLEREIGRGHFGRVFKGSLMYKSDKKDVAVKLLGLSDLTSTGTTSSAASLLWEVCILERVSERLEGDQHIVPFYGAVMSSDHLFLASEYLPGGDLKTYLQRNASSLDILSLLRILYDVICGIKVLHSQKVIHCDVAARNFLMDADKHARISDFGMSKIMSKSTEVFEFEKLPVKWMPPEAILQREFSFKTDIWSFGVVALEIFSLGKDPLPLLKNSQILDMVYKGNAVKLSEMLKAELLKMRKLPLKHVRTLGKCFDLPAARPSASELAELLKPMSS